MSDRIEVNLKARTIIDISGAAIETIPAGTEFTVTWYNELDISSRPSSGCNGLGISLIWNDEFEFIEEEA